MDHCDACDELGIAWERITDEYAGSQLFGAYDLSCKQNADLCRVANASKLAPLVVGDPARGLESLEPIDLAPIFAADWLYPALRDHLARSMPLCRFETQGDCDEEETATIKRALVEPLDALEARVISMFPSDRWWQLKTWQQDLQSRFANWANRHKEYSRKRLRFNSRRPRPGIAARAPAAPNAPAAPAAPRAPGRAPAAPQAPAAAGRPSIWVSKTWYRRRDEQRRLQRGISRALGGEYEEIAFEWAAWTQANAAHAQQVARSGYYLIKSVKESRDEREQDELEALMFEDEDEEDAAREVKEAAAAEAAEAEAWEAERRAWARPWKELTDEARQAALKLGLETQAQWDAGPPSLPNTQWSELSARQSKAAAALGFTELSWYYDVGSFGAGGSHDHSYYGVGSEGAVAEAAESLEKLSPEELAVAVQLGLTDASGLFWRAWVELSEDQRSLAVDLGRTPREREDDADVPQKA